MNSWLGVGGYTLLIYSTLPFGRTWLAFIDNLSGNNLNFIIFAVFGVIGIIILGWMYFYFSGTRLLLLFIILASLTIITISINLPEERVHLLEYAVLGYLITRAMNNETRLTVLVVIVSCIGFIICLGDELIQGLLADRVFDWRDVAFNGVGTVSGLLIMILNQPYLRRTA